jgi:hypothetical protein
MFTIYIVVAAVVAVDYVAGNFEVRVVHLILIRIG